MGPTVQLQKVSLVEQPASADTDIVFVYGVTAQDTFDSTSRWPKILPTLAQGNTNILGCDMKIRLLDQSGWKDLSSKGGDLLEAIYEYHLASKDNPRPIIFICYSLAGWILKQMLWRAAQQFNRFRNLIEVVSGIIFLATPHITEFDESSSRALSLILRADLMANSKRAFSKADLSGIAYTALRFEELKLQIPILSCYETQETKLRAPLWLHRKALLVGPNLAKTTAPGEKLVGIDTELQKLFDNTEAVIHLQIQGFLESTANSAGDRLQEVFRTDPETGRTVVSTLRSKSSTGSKHRDDTGSSRDRLTPISQNLSLPHSSRPMSSQLLSSSPHSFGTESSFEIIPRLSNFTSQFVQVNLPCFITRPFTTRNEDFQGRGEVLDLIDKALLPGKYSRPSSRHKGLKTFALCGLGGIGKTQVAVEYIFSRRNHYDAIFWVQADKKEKLASAFSHIAVSLGLETNENSNDSAVSRELVKGWLAEPIQNTSPFDVKLAKWLIVFDNADKPDEIKPTFWPQDGQGSVLITSRDPMAKSNFYFGDNGIDLQTLPVGDAVNLLRGLLQQDLEPTSEQLLVDIVRKLDCFPLAIIQMAGVIRRRSLSLAEFLDIYSQEVERSELHQLKVGTQQGYGLTLSSVWALEDLGSGAYWILSVISLLDPDCIQEEILYTWAPEKELPDFPQSKNAYLRNLSELVQSSIVRRDTDQNELSIPRVVQDVVRSQLRQSEDSLSVVFEVTAKLLSSVWPFVTKKVGYPFADRIDRWGQCDKILPHILRLRQTFEALDESEKRICATATVAWLLVEAARYQQERSNPKECIECTEAVFTLLKHSTEDLRDIRAEIHGTRATLAVETNEPEAALYHRQQNTALREEAYAETGILTSKLAATYSEYGRALMMSGLLTKAVEMFKRSIEIRQKLPDFTRVQLCTPLRCQGLIFWKNGEHEKAVELFLEALRDQEMEYGRDDTKSARTALLLYHLGSARYSQGQLDESFSYHQRALLLFRASVGDNNHFTAKACYRLSIHYIRLKDYAGAMKLLEQASKVYNRGAYYAQDLARVQFQMGQVLSLMGNIIGAEHVLRRAWEIRKGLVPGDLRGAEDLQEADFDELVVFCWA